MHFQSSNFTMLRLLNPVLTTFPIWKGLNIRGSHVPGRPRALEIKPQDVLPLAFNMHEVAGETAISPLDIIFSCCICQDTPSRIYKEPDDRLPLRQSKDGDFGRIAKLHLTGCAHVICTKHFEGGGMYTWKADFLFWMPSDGFPAQAFRSTQWRNNSKHLVRIAETQKETILPRCCSPSRGLRKASTIPPFRKNTSKQLLQSSVSRIWRPYESVDAAQLVPRADMSIVSVRVDATIWGCDVSEKG